MKKLICLLLIAAILPISGCGNKSAQNSDKITIVATLFPQYDFARSIGGDKVDVTLLLPAGSESHNYDPSPSDMALISKSSLFIYTGDNMEPWAGDIASAVGSGVEILDVSKGINFSASADSAHEEDTAADGEHHHSLDPHVWLDFDNAKTMAANIANALTDISPENSAYFSENLKLLCSEIDNLDMEYQLLFNENTDKALVFGGKFALGYLVKRYNIKYLSAYDSCSANSEPSISDIATLSRFVSENNVKAVFCEEYTDPKVAREIASANNAEVLVIHSCHNINKEEREAGVTFIDLMKQNLENLRKGLS